MTNETDQDYLDNAKPAPSNNEALRRGTATFASQYALFRAVLSQTLASEGQKPPYSDIALALLFDAYLRSRGHYD